MDTRISYTIIDSPVGKLRLEATDRGLSAVIFERSDLPGNMLAERAPEEPVLKAAAKQLAEYFAGTRHDFELPLDMQGSVFQIKAWRALQTIPYGETISYGEQARRLGDANKARAVGAANGRNPIAIVVPCHRVIGASGALTGFGGGLKTKQALLDLEKRAAASRKAA